MHYLKRVKFLKVKVKSLSRVRLFVTPWTVASQAPPAMGFSRQECWSGLPFPSAGDLPNPGIEPGSPTLQADALPSESPVLALQMLEVTCKTLLKIHWQYLARYCRYLARYEANIPYLFTNLC